MFGAINRATGTGLFDYVYIDEDSFNKYSPKKFVDLLSAFREDK